MEVAGFAIGVIGIAGIFNTCLDSLARFQSYRSSNAESHLLDTRFRAARARFEQWGVGLKLLWIHAPAGFGKTILCAHIIQHLSSVQATPVAHFFFTSDHESREGPFVALRSWISQIAAQNEDAFQRVHEAWETDSAETASRRTLIELFSAINHSVPGCIFIADGLDECFQLGNEDSSVARFLSDVISAVADSSAKFLFTSRDEPEIRSALENNATKFFTEYRVLPEDVQADTAVFSQSIVNIKLSNKSEDIRTSISEAMTERCEGQFLWIKMQEESLRKGMSKKRLHEVVQNSPSGLDRLYDHNWKRILDMSQWERDRVFALLRWATFAMRPLNVYEITEAVLIAQFEELDPEEYPDSIDDDYIRTEIIGLCGPLLEIRDNLDWPDAGFRRVRLPHFSVRQYLSQRLPIPSWIHDNGQLQTHYERTQHTVLARSCIQYINLPQIWADTSDRNARYQTLRHYTAVFCQVRCCFH
ncbi:ankyrin-1 [Fusarium avenaceum]|nr:ankyrin-1 [Fusarium avenaceum]